MSEIIKERGKVYGDPTENHKGIAAMWSPMLQPWAAEIARGEPLPPHVVMLLMALVKVNRMRRVYHEDNYVDAVNYLQFAKDEQKKHLPTFGERRPANFVHDPMRYE